MNDKLEAVADIDWPTLLTKAVGDIAALLSLMGDEDKISAWTADYCAAINRADALPSTPSQDASARPAVGEDVVERVARALHADKNALDGMCYADAELKDWGDGDLKTTVDGEVNFSALARAAIVALCGAAPLTDPQPVA